MRDRHPHHPKAEAFENQGVHNMTSRVCDLFDHFFAATPSFDALSVRRSACRAPHAHVDPGLPHPKEPRNNTAGRPLMTGAASRKTLLLVRIPLRWLHGSSCVFSFRCVPKARPPARARGGQTSAQNVSTTSYRSGTRRSMSANTPACVTRLCSVHLNRFARPRTSLAISFVQRAREWWSSQCPHLLRSASLSAAQ